jgi:predicted phosphodiesterase
MKVAIISDIHGNMDAFERVLADIAGSRVDDIISLGDNIGYGPEPDSVIKRIRQRDITSVQGNHELALIKPSYLSWFNAAARQSLTITLKLLSAQSIEFISKLGTHLSAYGCRFVHGFPPNCPLTYLFQVSEDKKIKTLENLSEKRCFIGHTHTLDLIGSGRQGLECDYLKEGLNKLDARRKYIISAGSVGQPRDGNNKSKYLIWDSSEDTVEVRYVAYDIAAVVKKIQAAGLPQEHAERLW